MGSMRQSDEYFARLSDCASPSEAMRMLVEDGMELSDEQLEAVAGGIDGWTFEQFLETFGENLSSLLPAGFNPASIWGNLPTGGTH